MMERTKKIKRLVSVLNENRANIVENALNFYSDIVFNDDAGWLKHLKDYSGRAKVKEIAKILKVSTKKVLDAAVNWYYDLVTKNDFVEVE